MTEGRLREAIDTLGKWDLLDVQKSFFEKLIQICDEEDTSIISDVTNTYFSEISSSPANPRRDKQGIRGRRLIQIGLGLQKNRFFQ